MSAVGMGIWNGAAFSHVRDEAGLDSDCGRVKSLIAEAARCNGSNAGCTSGLGQGVRDAWPWSREGRSGLALALVPLIPQGRTLSPFALLSSQMPLNVGIPFSTHPAILLKTLFGVRCACGGLLLTSLSPGSGTILARSSCAMLFMGENCFHSGWRSTKSWCTARERSSVTWNHFVAVGFAAAGEKGMGGGGAEGAAEGAVVGVRVRRLLGEVMAEVSCVEDGRGRLEGSSSGSAV